MKDLYYTPHQVGKSTLIVLAIFSLIAIATLEWERQLPYQEGMVESAKLAQQMMETVKRKKIELGHKVSKRDDPLQSGMIGSWHSPITSVRGDRKSKQTTVNPNFAALIYRFLVEAGVSEGDTVAVGATASYPALNLHTYAALKVLNAKPVVIHSMGSSQWGANLPDFGWLDMERALYEEGLINFRSIKTSLGGKSDLALNNTKKGRSLLEEMAKRNGVPLLRIRSIKENVAERVKLYRSNAQSSIRAYINIGGGVASKGKGNLKHIYKPGLNLPKNLLNLHQSSPSVMKTFGNEGIPLIQLRHAAKIAKEYQLPYAPKTAPQIGKGRVYEKPEYNRVYALGFLLFLLAGYATPILWKAKGEKSPQLQQQKEAA